MLASRLVPAGLLAGCWSACAEAQRLGGGGGQPEVSLVRILTALVVCLAAAFAFVLVIRGRNGAAAPFRQRWLRAPFGNSGRIEVVEVRRLSPFADACLVRCDDTEYFLVCGPSGQTVLTQVVQSSGARQEAGDAE